MRKLSLGGQCLRVVMIIVEKRNHTITAMYTSIHIDFNKYKKTINNTKQHLTVIWINKDYNVISETECESDEGSSQNNGPDIPAASVFYNK